MQNRNKQDDQPRRQARPKMNREPSQPVTGRRAKSRRIENRATERRPVEREARTRRRASPSAPVYVTASMPGAVAPVALAVSHYHLVNQVAALTVVVVQLWELNNVLRQALGLPREPLPLEAAMACVAGRGV